MSRPLAKQKQAQAMRRFARIHVFGEPPFVHGEPTKHGSVVALSEESCYYINLYLQEVWNVLESSREHVPDELQARIDRLLDGLEDA